MSVFVFWDNELSKYQWISTKLDICIDIVELWFGFADRQILLIFDSYLWYVHWYCGVLVLDC